MTNKKNNKPLVETMINTSALALTATGTSFLLGKDYWGFLIILFGMGLEFFKYKGRQLKLW